jgi:hypothetical protein
MFDAAPFGELFEFDQRMRREGCDVHDT